VPVPIAELFVSVSADTSAATAGLRSLSNNLNTTTNSFQAARPAALAMVGASVAVGAAFAASANVAADFESQMSGVKAVMSPTEVAQFGEALTQLALQLGRDTAFSAREAAAGIEEMIKAGIPAEAILRGAGAAATDLAAATGIGVAEAATVAAQAINTFGVDASTMTPVVDRLAAVANASAADISFLRFALAAAGGVAAGVGLSFEDTAVAIGAISSRFATGADTGTSFKAFLNGLIPDTKEQKKQFRELGLSTDEMANAFFDAEGKIRPISDVVGTLQDALSGLTDLERASRLVKIFGTDGQRAAEAFFQLGRAGIETFNDQTNDAGVAAQSARTRLDNLRGALSNLGSSFETAQIIVGNLFLPTLREIATFTRSLVDRFSALSPETQKLGIFVTGAGAAFLGLLGVLALIGSFIPGLIVSFGALNAIFLANPVGLIVTAIAALAAIFVVLFNNNEDFRNLVLEVWNVIQNQFVPAVLDAARALGEALGPVMADVGTQFQKFVTEFGPVIVDFFTNQLPGALAAMGTQLTSLGPLFGSLGNFFGALFNLIGTLASTGATALRGLFDNVLVPGFQALTGAIGPLQPAVDGMNSALTSLGSGFSTIGATLQPVTDFFNNLAAAITAFTTAAAGLESNLPGFLRPGSGIGLPGLPGPQLAPVGFAPGGATAGGAGGGVIIQGDVNIGSEVDADNFLNRMAALMAGSASRVNPPPDNSGTPALDFT
jgi:TP901 family phage tail tape measure protein